MITFTSAADTAAPGDWGQIAFEDSSSGSIVSHSKVEYAIRGLKSRSSSITIGPGNITAHNMYHGVEVHGSGTISNVITQNSFFDNGAKGIHLASGANGGIEPPVVAGISVGPVRITGTACALCTVEVFANRDTDGEGETYIGSTTADGSGDFVLTLAGPLGKPFLTATATNVVSGTSEFSSVFDSEIRNVFLPLVFKNY